MSILSRAANSSSFNLKSNPNKPTIFFESLPLDLVKLSINSIGSGLQSQFERDSKEESTGVQDPKAIGQEESIEITIEASRS